MFGSTINSVNSWFNANPVEVLVMRACDPTMHEPNYALHLEVAEHINQKKANTPREAAMMIARLVNNRNPHVSILALALLNTLVQSCGYPFHLQISTKEFLNELVRRFPERPPPFPGPVMSRILELIHGWKEGICVDSRWRDDLQNIRDMHRLLTFKGYRFREIPRAPASMTATNNLKTAEELEEEDRDAQSAKLQELIRRGTPRDLAAAQELMKSLAGADPERKPDYRSQSLTELNKLEQKVILLNEMLDNVDTSRGERFASGDVYDQVASILTSARPKIQKWIEDAQQDDPESLDTYLQVNDQINTVLGRYDSFKKGDFTAAANPIPAEIASNSRGGGGDSLIEFDDPMSSSTMGGPGSNSTAADLADIFGFNAPSSPGAPQAAFGLPITSAANTSPPPPAVNATTRPTYASSSAPAYGSPSLGMPTQPQSNFGSIMLPSTPGRMASPSLGGAPSRTSPSGPMQPQYQQQQQPIQQAAPAAQKDPFADLAGLF